MAVLQHNDLEPTAFKCNANGLLEPVVKETVTTIVDNGNGTVTHTSEDGTVTTFSVGGGVTVNNTPIAFVPASTGNTTNLGEVVTDPDGNVWIIDGNGEAVMVECNQGFKIDTANLTTAAPSTTGHYSAFSTNNVALSDSAGMNDYYTLIQTDSTITYSYTGFPDPVVDFPLGINANLTGAMFSVNFVSGALSVLTMEILVNGVSAGSAAVTQTAGTVTTIPLSVIIVPTDVVTAHLFTPDTDASGDSIGGFITLIYT